MSKTTPVLAAIALGATILSGILWQQLQTEREQTGELRDLVAQLRRVPVPVATQVSPQPEINSGSAQARSASEALPADAPGLRSRNAGTMVSVQDRPKDPDPRAARRAQLRRTVELNNPDIARELGLNAEETSALLDLMTERNLGPDGNSAASSPEERNAALLATRQTQDAALKALLGDDRYQKWQQYQQGAYARQQVMQLRTAFAGAGQPLNDEQTKALIAAASAEQSRQFAAQRAAMTAGGDLNANANDVGELEASNRRLVDAASSVLTQRQLGAYEQLLNQQLNMRRLNQVTPPGAAR